MRILEKLAIIVNDRNGYNYGIDRNKMKDMEALKKEQLYTIDDIYALPEGERAELINGQIYYIAPPSWEHQRISRKLHQAIANYIDSNNGKCETLAAPFAVFLNEEDETYIEPDISVICNSSKLDSKGCHGAPDWVVEIVSPSSKYMDYFTKLFKYHNTGVKEYWIVDPIKEHITVYFFEKELMEQYSFGEEIPVGIYEGFSIKVE